MTRTIRYHTATHKIEIQYVRYNIALLHKLKKSQNNNEKRLIFNKLDTVVQNVLKEDINKQYILSSFNGVLHFVKNIFVKTEFKNIDEYISRLNTAIKIDKYRPQNLSLFELAASPDLYNINGDFDTFNIDLKRAKNDEKRKMFDDLTAIRKYLTPIWAYDWICRLHNHNVLVLQVKRATPENQFFAYTQLFNALADDFCKEYGINRKTLKISIVKDIPNHPNATGEHQIYVTLPCNINISSKEKQQLKSEAKNGIFYNPALCKESIIKISIDRIKQKYKNEDLFNYVMRTFVHEIHHALDFQRAEMGVLGPQVELEDRNIFVDVVKHRKQYLQSATERSAHSISDAVLKLLKYKKL